MSSKSVLGECQARASHKSVKSECQARVSYQSVAQWCQARVSYKSVTSVCQVNVFNKWVRWKLWQISIKSLFLNIRVGIQVRGLHLVFFFVLVCEGERSPPDIGDKWCIYCNPSSKMMNVNTHSGTWCDQAHVTISFGSTMLDEVQLGLFVTIHTVSRSLCSEEWQWNKYGTTESMKQTEFDLLKQKRPKHSHKEVYNRWKGPIKYVYSIQMYTVYCSGTGEMRRWGWMKQWVKENMQLHKHLKTTKQIEL